MLTEHKCYMKLSIPHMDGLRNVGNALSELRTLFRGFHALAEVEKVYLERKEFNFLHWCGFWFVFVLKEMLVILALVEY